MLFCSCPQQQNSSMKKKLLLTVCSLAWLATFSQSRPINKMTMQTTYSQVDIEKSTREYVDAQKREDYFKDEFFNAFLAKTLQDPAFTARQKVQVFYLMLKKIGYSFAGVNYLPPKQNYFIFHLSKISVLEKTQNVLQSAKLDVSPILALADELKTNDPIISANALLLSMLMDRDKTTKLLQKISQPGVTKKSKNPAIINHYVCLSASLTNDSSVRANLRASLFSFKQEAMLEDLFCAIYSKQAPLGDIKDYILQETNEQNDLVIETAACILQTRISAAAYVQNLKTISGLAVEPWKKTLLNDLANNKFPYTYALTSDNQLVPKVWDGVQMSLYTDGTLISNNALLEFEPN